MELEPSIQVFEDGGNVFDDLMNGTLEDSSRVFDRFLNDCMDVTNRNNNNSATNIESNTMSVFIESDAYMDVDAPTPGTISSHVFSDLLDGLQHPTDDLEGSISGTNTSEIRYHSGWVGLNYFILINIMNNDTRIV